MHEKMINFTYEARWQCKGNHLTMLNKLRGISTIGACFVFGSDESKYATGETHNTQKLVAGELLIGTGDTPFPIPSFTIFCQVLGYFATGWWAGSATTYCLSGFSRLS